MSGLLPYLLGFLTVIILCVQAHCCFGQPALIKVNAAGSPYYLLQEGFLFRSCLFFKHVCGVCPCSVVWQVVVALSIRASYSNFIWNIFCIQGPWQWDHYSTLLNFCCIRKMKNNQDGQMITGHFQPDLSWCTIDYSHIRMHLTVKSVAIYRMKLHDNGRKHSSKLFHLHHTPSNKVLPKFLFPCSGI